MTTRRPSPCATTGATERAAGVGFQVVDGDRRHGFERAAHRLAVGMAGERRCPPVAARHVVGADHLAPQPRHDLRAHALDRVSVEARLGQRKPQIVERFVAVLGKRAQGAAQIVASGAEAELDRLAFEPVVEGIGIEGAGAVVEQARCHMGDAGFVLRVLIGAAEEGEVDGDERQGAVADQPWLTTRSIFIARAGRAASAMAAQATSVIRPRAAARRIQAFTSASPGRGCP